MEFSLKPVDSVSHVHLFIRDYTSRMIIIFKSANWNIRLNLFYNIYLVECNYNYLSDGGPFVLVL